MVNIIGTPTKVFVAPNTALTSSTPQDQENDTPQQEQPTTDTIQGKKVVYEETPYHSKFLKDYPVGSVVFVSGKWMKVVGSEIPDRKVVPTVDLETGREDLYTSTQYVERVANYEAPVTSTDMAFINRTERETSSLRSQRLAGEEAERRSNEIRAKQGLGLVGYNPREPVEPTKTNVTREGYTIYTSEEYARLPNNIASLPFVVSTRNIKEDSAYDEITFTSKLSPSVQHSILLPSKSSQIAGALDRDYLSYKEDFERDKPKIIKSSLERDYNLHVNKFGSGALSLQEFSSMAIPQYEKQLSSQVLTKEQFAVQAIPAYNTLYDEGIRQQLSDPERQKEIEQILQRQEEIQKIKSSPEYKLQISTLANVKDIYYNNPVISKLPNEARLALSSIVGVEKANVEVYGYKNYDITTKEGLINQAYNLGDVLRYQTQATIYSVPNLVGFDFKPNMPTDPLARRTATNPIVTISAAYGSGSVAGTALGKAPAYIEGSARSLNVGVNLVTDPKVAIVAKYGLGAVGVIGVGKTVLETEETVARLQEANENDSRIFTTRLSSYGSLVAGAIGFAQGYGSAKADMKQVVKVEEIGKGKIGQINIDSKTGELKGTIDSKVRQTTKYDVIAKRPSDSLQVRDIHTKIKGKIISQEEISPNKVETKVGYNLKSYELIESGKKLDYQITKSKHYITDIPETIIKIKFGDVVRTKSTGLDFSKETITMKDSTTKTTFLGELANEKTGASLKRFDVVLAFKDGDKGAGFRNIKLILRENVNKFNRVAEASEYTGGGKPPPTKPSATEFVFDSSIGRFREVPKVTSADYSLIQLKPVEVQKTGVVTTTDTLGSTVEAIAGSIESPDVTSPSPSPTPAPVITQTVQKPKVINIPNAPNLQFYSPTTTKNRQETPFGLKVIDIPVQDTGEIPILGTAQIQPPLLDTQIRQNTSLIFSPPVTNFFPNIPPIPPIGFTGRGFNFVPSFGKLKLENYGGGFPSIKLEKVGIQKIPRKYSRAKVLSDYISEGISMIRYGKATSPKSTIREVEKSSFFLRNLTVEERQSKNKFPSIDMEDFGDIKLIDMDFENSLKKLGKKFKIGGFLK